WRPVAAVTTSEPSAAAVSAKTTTVAPEPTALSSVSALVPIRFAHLGRWLRFQCLYPDGEEAQDVGMQAHATLHLDHGAGGRIDIHQRIVRFPVLLDLERQ